MGNIFAINVGLSLDKMVSYCWQQTCSTRESFQSLQKDWERLRTARNDVRTRIDAVLRQEMKTMLESVDEWLKEVETIETDFAKLKTDYSQQSANKCCCGYCPRNFKTSYTLGKNIAHVREEVISLLERQPDEVAQKSAITRPVEILVEPTVGMDAMLDKAWSYMEDGQVGIIAIHGMGGVGKTTLMKELYNKLCNSTQTSFDFFFWIVISSNLSLSKVQNDIGKDLGFDSNEWKEKSQSDKAKDISKILKQKKFVLFLDDVWKRIDLLDLGVPHPDQRNESKVVLTTRSRVVCVHMEAHKKIEVTCLKEKEAWNLFRGKVTKNTINAHPEIEEIAKLVAKECAGLPLALIVIGRAMSSRTTPRSWTTALNRLQKQATDFEGMGDHILPLLKFSYDNIPNPATKSCFLYCSLYPEDNLISKVDIIDKWICEGFLDRFDDLEDARNEGYDYIDNLVNASLLLQESSLEEIKMHDIIREMAIWIGCECGVIKNKFFVRAGFGLTETPNVAEFEGSERMSLMGNQIDKLIGKPNCPNLITLFLREAKLSHIDNGFFESMEKLRVLDFSDNWNLLELPDEVCNLETLQYLNLSNTKLSKLPINLCKLINLKWLSVSWIINDIQIPEGMLSNLKKLRVLNLSYAKVVLPETFVEEIEGLKQLNDLRIRISNDVHLSRLTYSHKLARITTSLEVNQMTTTTNLDCLVSHKMVNLNYLEIQQCGELEYVTSRELNGTTKVITYNGYFQSLKSLHIFFCPKLKDITVLTFAPNLERIEIGYCPAIKELCGEWKWEGGSPTPFQKLNYLQLGFLPKLKRIIYPNAMLPLFPCLKHMWIRYCPKLKKLPFNSSSCDSRRGIIIIEGYASWWNGLEWEDEDTRIAFLPFFKPL